ncbi:hypothetical protein [Oceanobacillus sojae]
MDLITQLQKKIENNIYKTGNDGTRYYLLSREELEEIIEELEEEHNG